jgi:hypothetical protein
MPIKLRRSLIAVPSCAILAAGLLVPAGASAGARHRREAAAESPSTAVSESGTPATTVSSTEPAAPQESGSGKSESGSPAPRVRGRRHGKCELSLQASSELVTAGETVTLQGRLLCPGGTIATGETVTLNQRQLAGGPSASSALAAAISDEGGSFQTTSAPLTARSVFVVRSTLARHGARIVVRVAPKVTLEGPATAGAQLATRGARTAAGGPGTTVRGRSRLTFTGTVTPSTPGTLVALQREYATAGEQWHTIAFARVGPEGRYTIAHGFRSAGEVSVRVLARPKGEVSAASEPLTYEIVQAQNPQLTIESSADPIALGASATIAGVAAGAPGQTVTLQARTPGQSFEPVTKATTDMGGAYTFSVTPIQNTSYRVLSANATSTELLEGVRYALAPTPPPSTVQDGATVAFSGTLTPAPTGQAVYLECEDAHGVGFHIVASGTVGVAYSYSIPYAFHNAGSRVMRIKVKRTPQILGTTSAPFTIAVTPSAPAVVTPPTPVAGQGEAPA